MQLFLHWLNMGVSGSVGAMLLILWRQLSKGRIPRRFFYILWGVVFLRLCVPASFSSAFSVLGLFARPAAVESGGRLLVTMRYLDEAELQTLAGGPGSRPLLTVLAFVWLAGALALMVWWLTACWRARRALRYAVLCPLPEAGRAARQLGLSRAPRVFRSERVASPILLGLLRPRIILPAESDLSGEGLECVLAHEMVHCRRHDPLIKAAAFFIAAFHWYNPLVWWCFYLLNEDVETSCDQAVLEARGFDCKAHYARALAGCAAQSLRFRMGYLAFARSRVAARVSGILRYRPLPRWQLALFAAVTVALGLGVSANPVLAEYYTCTPAPVRVSGDTKTQANLFAKKFLEQLAAGDGAALARSSSADGAYFAPLYADFAPMEAEPEQTFYTGEGSAVLYLTLEEPHPRFPGARRLVLELESSRLMGGFYAERLQSYETYEAVHRVNGDSEAVMLCRKMIEYGLTDGRDTPENGEVIAAFCADIARRRAGGTGEWVEGAAVEAVAAEFFAIGDFTNLRASGLYDPAQKAYRFAPGLAARFEYQILRLEETAQGAVVTVEFYADPLQTRREKTVQYTFTRVE